MILVMSGVVGESWSKNYTNSSEILNLANENIKCTISDFPVALSKATGDVVNGIPIVCGGYGDSPSKSKIK